MFMIILPGLMIAIVNAVVIWYFWERKIAWWETLPPIFLNIIICVLAKYTAETSLTTDYEYWGGWGIVTCHQEPWTREYEVDVDDYCTRTVPDGKGTRTETYKCGSHKETRYDSNPERWWLENSNGETIDTDSGDYGLLSKSKWKNETREDGNHSRSDRVRYGFHYTGDGYLYKSKWPGTDETFVPTTTKHSYTNKVQAADQSLFHFEKVDKEDFEEYGLYDLPEVVGYYRMQYLHGNGGPNAEKANQRLEEWNGKLGREKQVQMRLLVFTDKTQEAAQNQESHWMGGNKNEFIVCVGVDGKTREAKWAYVISWTESETLKVKVRDFARSMKPFDPVALVDYMIPQIRQDFVRKSFAEFDYLKVATPAWAYWVAFIVSLLVTVGFDYWAINNDIDA
jgi:hypothetical protein